MNRTRVVGTGIGDTRCTVYNTSAGARKRIGVEEGQKTVERSNDNRLAYSNKKRGCGRIVRKATSLIADCLDGPLAPRTVQFWVKYGTSSAGLVLLGIADFRQLLNAPKLHYT